MATADDTSPPPKPRPRPGAVLVRALLALIVLLGVLVAAGRLGVLAPQVRLLIEAQTDGLKVGRLGRLKLEGLSGDIWRDFAVRRLTLRDARGVWLEADNVRLSWRYDQLLQRRFQADRVQAAQIRLLRRPKLSAPTASRGLPVSVRIGQASARLVFEPAFSGTRGVYDLGLSLDLARGGGGAARLKATSVLHPGDHLDLDYAAGRGPLRLVADAEEARGGALAGALGLPADQPFRLDLRADGTTSAGRFTARATSGAMTPLLASGAWTPQGGQAGGRLLLSASDLTRPWALRLGDDLRFGVAGRKAAEGVFALDAKLRSEAATAHAWGFGDLGKRALSPAGVRLAAQAPVLSRITGGPDMGAARIEGVLKGAAAAWRFEGTGSVADLRAGAYGLSRVAGPLDLGRDRGGYRLQARLTGVGGAGQGYAAALLGGAPGAVIDAERLRDGRLSLRRLEVSGRGLKLTATGGRGLLGGLGFKGRADIANLAEARQGAAGQLGLAWEASQARAGAPWAFSFDARGDGLATGLVELDRLLGDKPRLQAQAEWQAGRLAVSRASLDGAALAATAAGAMEADRALRFTAEWSASGPFRAGPVEVTGKARGTGGLTGSVSAPRLDLLADIEQLDAPRLPLTQARLSLTFQRQPDGSSGTVALTAASAYGPARARADFRFPEGGVDLTGLSVDAGGLKASGALSLRRRRPSAANLSLEVVHGAFLDGGRITGTARIADGPAGAQAVLDLKGDNLPVGGSGVTVRAIRVTADGPLDRLPYAVDGRGASGQGAWTLSGKGVLTDARPGYRAAFDGMGTLGGRDLHTTETAVFRYSQVEKSARIRLVGSDGGRLDLDGLLRDGAADVKARVAGMGLNLFDADFDGRVDATLALQGRGRELSGTLDARLNSARGRGTPADQGVDGTLKARLAGDSLTLDLATANQGGLRGDASVILPVEASAAPFRIAIARQRPLKGRFAAEGEVRPLWELAVGGDRALSGQVRTEGVLSGTLARPKASGTLAVDRGRFDDGPTGLSLREVVMRAAFTEAGVDVTEARGTDGHGGQVSGQGRISAREGVSSFRLDLKGFRLIDNETATASATGQATIARTPDGKVKLAGDLAIDRADVAAEPPVPSGVVAMDVREVNRPDDLPAALPHVATAGDGWQLDVRLRAPRRVFLKGRGLDMELSLDAHVGGTSSSPQLSGVARVVRGDYEFAGKRFEFDDRSVVYLGARAANIRLQLDAVREDPTLTVTVRIRGTAERPEISLTSSPSLPNDEILAKVLFERSASQLSPVEAAQLASALSSLAGGGGLDIIGNLRSFAGLDRLAFGGNDTSGVTVSGGKYLTDDVYLELTGGGREGPSAQVEWRVRKNLSILSRIAGQAGNRLAVRWRRDY